MHVNAHPLCVNIGYLKKQGFMQSKAAGINGGQISFVLDRIDRIDDGPNFVNA